MLPCRGSRRPEAPTRCRAIWLSRRPLAGMPPALTATAGACERRVTKRPNSCGLSQAGSQLLRGRERGPGLGISPATTPPAAGRRPRRRGSALYAQHPNGPPDRRRVSLRWLAGSVLTGIFSVALVGGALQAAIGLDEYLVVRPALAARHGVRRSARSPRRATASARCRKAR